MGMQDVRNNIKHAAQGHQQIASLTLIEGLTGTSSC